jgi:hypothetical protein
VTETPPTVALFPPHRATIRFKACLDAPADRSDLRNFTFNPSQPVTGVRVLVRRMVAWLQRTQKGMKRDRLAQIFEISMEAEFLRRKSSFKPATNLPRKARLSTLLVVLQPSTCRYELAQRG